MLCLSRHLLCVYWFFFFQAEDGIRDYKVTGVQTCALPISLRVVPRVMVRIDDREIRLDCGLLPLARPCMNLGARSEERRVGKECRARWSAYQCGKMM